MGMYQFEVCLGGLIVFSMLREVGTAAKHPWIQSQIAARVALAAERTHRQVTHLQTYKESSVTQ